MANSPKLSGKHDLPAIIVLTALLIVCIILIPSNIPRIIIGLPFILFFPGYTLVAALFPRKESLSGIERSALSFGLSIAVVPLIGLLLNYIWEISLYPMLISIAGFVVIMCILAYFQRRRLTPEQRFEPRIQLSINEWNKKSGLNRVLTVILGLAIVGTIGTLIYAIAVPRTGEEFTEFYISGSFSIAGYYPSELAIGEKANVSIAVINHEGEDVTYRVRVSIGSTEAEVIDGIVLHSGGKWENDVTLTPTEAGDHQKVEFLLYRDGESEPYRELHLWINVLG
jgi:uncharacterized membrane protein